MSISKDGQKFQSVNQIVDGAVSRALDLQERVASLHNFKFFEVTYPEELNDINVAPPACAYVRKVGDFYFRHGPEFWWGRVGTPEAAFSDREDNKWVRACYSGDRAQFRGMDIEYLSGQAQLALSRLISDGTKHYNITKLKEFVGEDTISGGFWDVARQLWYLSHNYNLAELNEQACGTEGERLYDIESGDIVVQGPQKAWCVQGKTKNPEQVDKYFGRQLQLIGQKPLIEGTPGIHIQKRKLIEQRISITESHPESLGFVVSESAIPKGATSFSCKIYPHSLPKLVEGGGKSWVEHEQSDSSGKPEYKLSAPQGAPWNVNRFAWLQSPDQVVEIGVSGFSGVSEGRMPNALNASLTLEQGCPVPLTFGSVVYGKTEDEPYLMKPTRSFGWHPRGTFGGYLGKTEISIRVKAHSHSYLNVHSASGVPEKTKQLNPLATWINKQGQESHSPLRGIKKGDFFSIDNYNHVYKVEEVDNTKTLNPFAIRFTTPLIHSIAGNWQTLDGVWVSGAEINYIIGELDDSMYTSFTGWPVPTGGGAVPLIVKSFNFNTVTLAAPVGKTIPAGTKLPIWISTDNDSVTYCYDDFYEFMFNLEQWLEIKEGIGRKAIMEKLDHVTDLLLQIEKAHARAEEQAKLFWYQYPYYINRDLNDFIPEGLSHYGSTWTGIRRHFTNISLNLYKLLNIKPPSWNSRNYISLLQYSHNGISGA